MGIHQHDKIHFECVKLIRIQLDARDEHDRNHSCPMRVARVTMSPCFSTPDVLGLSLTALLVPSYQKVHDTSALREPSACPTTTFVHFPEVSEH
jgi:hypothetical protein